MQSSATKKNMLDSVNWGYFKIRDLFKIEPTKGTTTDDLVSGHEIPYIAAKKDNNGLETMCSKEDNLDFISKGNCIVFIQLGQGSAGYTTYQENDFIGMNGKTSCGYNEQLNKYNALFVVTILDKERPRFSFGRSWTGNRLINTKIKLPIDENRKPNWQFMENYIKSIYLNTPQIIKQPLFCYSLSLLHRNWNYFYIGKLFEIKNCKCSNASELLEDGDDIFYIGAKKNDNGVMNKVKINNDFITKGNCIIFICDGQGSVGYSNYIDVDFIGSTTLSVGYNKNLNKYNAMFLVSILDLERSKYSFGRKYKKFLHSTKIKLPVDSNGNPDWQFMEDYIKSLPYSTNL